MIEGLTLLAGQPAAMRQELRQVCSREDGWGQGAGIQPGTAAQGLINSRINLVQHAGVYNACIQGKALREAFLQLCFAGCGARR